MHFKPFSLDAHAADVDLTLTTPTQKELAHIGVQWKEGPGKYKLIKVINLVPRFLLKNTLTESLCYREYCAAPSEHLVVGAGQIVPIHLFKRDERKLLTFAPVTSKSSWCSFVTLLPVAFY
jgi:vacuolar protein sorting-associated protein 13A/C